MAAKSGGTNWFAIWVSVGVVVALALIAGLVVWMNNSTNDPGAAPQSAVIDQETGAISVGDGEHTLGTFIDFMCPVCKQFEGQFGPTLDDMSTKGEIQLIYRTMTFLDNNLKNDSSTKAGIAAACADNAGSYSAYHNAIFAGQPTTEGEGYTTQQLRVDFAATAGITGDKLSGFQACYDTRATSAFVEGTNEGAAKAGVNSTPTIMVNGTKLDNSKVFQLSTDAFRQTVLTTKGNG